MRNSLVVKLRISHSSLTLGSARHKNGTMASTLSTNNKSFHSMSEQLFYFTDWIKWFVGCITSSDGNLVFLVTR